MNANIYTTWTTKDLRSTLTSYTERANEYHREGLTQQAERFSALAKAIRTELASR